MEYRRRREKSRPLSELTNEAKNMGAHGVLSIDFEFAELLEASILTTAYRTAVKLKE